MNTTKITDMKKKFNEEYYSLCTLLSNVRCFLKAHILDYKYWRVSYDNEPRFTRLLGKSEAKGLADCFEGKAWIDYEHCR